MYPCTDHKQNHITVSAENKPSTNAGLILGQRRRRWTSIKATLIRRPVFTGECTSFTDNQPMFSTLLEKSGANIFRQ